MAIIVKIKVPTSLLPKNKETENNKDNRIKILSKIQHVQNNSRLEPIIC